MGASITIRWVDGPTTKQVDHLVGAFKGKGFDGMIDCGYYYESWLLPDGTATIAKCKSSGTTITPYENDSPHPDAELVSFGSDYIHTDRDHSPAFVRRVAAEVAERTGWTAPEIKEQSSYWSKRKRITTAYFERGHTAEDDRNEREFTHALYSTSADSPAVLRGDELRIEEDEPEPEPEIEYVDMTGELSDLEKWELKQDLAECVASFGEQEAPPRPLPTVPTPAEINAHLIAQDAAVKAQGAGADPKTIAHEDRTPEERAEVEAVWAETARQIDEPEPDRHALRVARELRAEIALVAQEIAATQPGLFVLRCVSRKVDALGETADLDTLFEVGADLALIAAKLGA
jgi:hypothetical protein